MAVHSKDELVVFAGHGAVAGELKTVVDTSNRVRLLGADSLDEASRAPRLAVFACASRLHEVSTFVSHANRGNRLRALLVDTDIETEWLPYVFERANLRLLRNLLVHHGALIPTRFVWAWNLGIQSRVIADATAMGDRLVVRSCSLKSYEIPFAAYPALSRIPRGEQREFDIDPDGMFLHWPGADVHLTMDDVTDAANPRRKARALLLKRASGEAFGTAVRTFRLRRGLRQKDIAGISERHLRRIEQGLMPGDGALDQLAKAHGMDPSDYLDELTELME